MKNLFFKIRRFKKCSIKATDMTKLFYVSYCDRASTQGITFEGLYTIFEWELMDPKLKYVALSRGTNKKNINFATLQKPKRYTPTCCMCRYDWKISQLSYTYRMENKLRDLYLKYDFPG